MSKDPAIYTRTMAKVFFEQGHYDKAIEIYRYLLKKNPDQPDLMDELKAAKKGRRLKYRVGAGNLTGLVGEWIDLLQKYRLIRILNRLWDKKK